MRRPLMVACLCLVIFCAVRLWIEGDARGEEQEELQELLDDQFVTATGQVYQKEDQVLYLESIVITSCAAIPQQNIPFVLKDNYICELAGQQEIPLGSKVQVQGRMNFFRDASNPGEFDQKKYYSSIGIGGKLKGVSVLAKSASFSLLKETLFKLRNDWKQRLYAVFPQKEASILTTMLLGDKEGLDSEVKELYQRNGIIHILSISGLHITLIGMSLYRLLRRLGAPVWMAALMGGAALFGFGIMTGMGVSACRAIGMYLIRMLGEILGRTYDMLTALGVVGVCMVWKNPLYLQHAGFLLSFGSILGIGSLYPVLRLESRRTAVLQFEENKWKAVVHTRASQLWENLLQALQASLSITLATLPIQLWFYFEVPAYAVCLNLVVLPLMTPVMLAGIFAMLVPGLGFLGWIDRWILAGYEILCRLFEMLPGNIWNPGQPRVWQMAGYYGILAFVIFFRSIHGEKKKEIYFFLLIALLLISCPKQAENVVTFLDVGQGDCILVQTEEGEHYLFDCGSSSRSKVGQYVLIPYLKSQGISHLDAVFISHADADHVNGVEELLQTGSEKGITIDYLVLPDVAQKVREGKLQGFVTMAEASAQREKIKCIFISAGDTWQKDSKGALAAIGAVWEGMTGSRHQPLKMTCLHPPAEYAPEGENAYSECFYLEFGSENESPFALLLTGDVEGEGEEQLLQELKKRNITDITLLKVAHHGSKYSTSEELLLQLNPQISIISCGLDNSYGHPHQELLARLEQTAARIYRTDQSGAITVKREKNNLRIDWWKPNSALTQ